VPIWKGGGVDLECASADLTLLLHRGIAAGRSIDLYGRCQLPLRPFS
jgi:hypothetical protein